MSRDTVRHYLRDAAALRPPGNARDGPEVARNQEAACDADGSGCPFPCPLREGGVRDGWILRDQDVAG